MHTPFVQLSVVVQHGTVPLQTWPVLAQVGPVPLWHVPLVAPGGISQESPEQQSAVTVHEPSAGWHAAWQSPSLQIVEQQSAPWLHAFPFGKHEVQTPPTQPPTQHSPLEVQAASGSLQPGGGVPVAQTQPISVTFVQVAPVQHAGVPPATQVAPLGRHWVGGSTQRRTPSAPGVHGAPPQHWSRNWQMAPGWMQQLGSLPSQPVGQSVVTVPPKQRMMPFESGLQTAVPLPPPSWQQFWEAL